MNNFFYLICRITNNADLAQAGSAGYGESKMPASVLMSACIPLPTQDWAHFGRKNDDETNTGRLMV